MILARSFATAAQIALISSLSGCATMGSAVLQAASEMGACTANYVQPHTLGTAVQGEWTASDCQREQYSVMVPVDFYRFTLPAERNVFVALDAPGLNPLISITRDDGTVVKEVGSDDYNTLEAQLAPGSYRIVVTPLGGSGVRSTGTYTMTTTTDEMGFGGCLSLPELRAGSTISGTWTVADCKSRPAGGLSPRVDYYLFTLAAQREVRVELDSPDVDAYLTLFRRDGTELATAAASQGPEQPERGVRTQLAPGQYVIAAQVRPYQEREAGSYTLRVR